MPECEPVRSVTRGAVWPGGDRCGDAKSPGLMADRGFGLVTGTGIILKPIGGGLPTGARRLALAAAVRDCGGWETMESRRALFMNVASVRLVTVCWSSGRAVRECWISRRIVMSSGGLGGEACEALW